MPMCLSLGLCLFVIACIHLEVSVQSFLRVGGGKQFLMLIDDEWYLRKQGVDGYFGPILSRKGCPSIELDSASGETVCYDDSDKCEIS